MKKKVADRKMQLKTAGYWALAVFVLFGSIVMAGLIEKWI